MVWRLNYGLIMNKTSIPLAYYNLLSSNYYVIVFPIKLIMRAQRGLEASISKKIRLRSKY